MRQTVKRVRGEGGKGKKGEEGYQNMEQKGKGEGSAGNVQAEREDL
jgi:hypothetical protein